MPENENIVLKHKILSIDHDFGDCSIIVKCPENWTKESLCFDSEEKLFVLDGNIEINDKVYENSFYTVWKSNWLRW